MYALIYNNQIEVGPRDWLYSMFKDFLDEEGLDASELPRIAPSEPIVTTQWKILPVESIDIPSYDSLFEQLSGPFLTINEFNVTGYYDVVPDSIVSSKSKMKTIVTNNRYYGENKGTTFTFSDGQKVGIYTSREDRNIYLQAYQIIQEGDTIWFKFPNSIFRNVTKEELGQIVATGSSWIQNAFNWEQNKYNEIDSATTVEELKTIELNNPIWTDGNAS